MLSLIYLPVDCECLHKEKSNVSNGPLLLKEALSLVTVYGKACVCFTSSNYASL